MLALWENAHAGIVFCINQSEFQGLIRWKLSKALLEKLILATSELRKGLGPSVKN